ncbi:MAG: hypothetical protein LBT46_04030 [Planctomycetaceae bacterium]|jgi:H+/Cl- antiporter ClcA|nr:hypothetical protein [Planctomycetaceae bacterium]
MMTLFAITAGGATLVLLCELIKMGVEEGDGVVIIATIACSILSAIVIGYIIGRKKNNPMIFYENVRDCSVALFAISLLILLVGHLMIETFVHIPEFLDKVLLSSCLTGFVMQAMMLNYRSPNEQGNESRVEEQKCPLKEGD